jgi:hypothetical protein
MRGGASCSTRRCRARNVAPTQDRWKCDASARLLRAVQRIPYIRVSASTASIVRVARAQLHETHEGTAWVKRDESSSSRQLLH